MSCQCTAFHLFSVKVSGVKTSIGFCFNRLFGKRNCKLYPRFCKKVPISSLQSIKTFSILSLGAHNLPFSTHCYIFLIVVTLLFTPFIHFIMLKCYDCSYSLQNHVISISCLKHSYCYSFNHSERTDSLNGMFYL